jgi:hypothetical protein
LALLIVWLAFFGGYTSFEGPLMPEEIATVMQLAELGRSRRLGSWVWGRARSLR